MAASESRTGMRGLVSPSSEVGVVSGFVLKLIRGSIGLTQTDMAERLGVDISTIQGWETGKRPLTAQRAADLLRLKTRLVMLGGARAAVGTLQDAIEADGILSLAIAAGGQPISVDFNPLAAAVHRQRLVHMITWPFTGILPPPLRDLVLTPARGPVAKHPILSSGDQARFFDHLLATVDSRQSAQMPVLRRQATYLLGFDRRKESADWLAAEHQRAFVAGSPSADLPAGIAARSATVALARHGDSDPLRYFIKHTLSREDHAAANLAYWAYWLGEITESYADDSYLIAGADEHGWAGGRLAAHLLKHLDNDVHSHLNIHSLWVLVLARPDLLRRDHNLRLRTGDRVEQALDAGFDGETRDELINLRCAVQLAGR
ncbi:helix-turn-helix transcriptional regulator [Kribbella sp. NPDC051718]|uniref:helix-turn-helix domain-containing protein n=1 Tax=Kribbella sp. NPDC051718 TaxID=3155168 RepID=UPI00342E691A